MVLAGLAGACGVGLSALAAHGPGGVNLSLAAQFLLFHAPVFLVLAIFDALFPLHRGVSRQVLTGATWFLAVGTGLFCGDLVLRAVLSTKLFPMAAPLGGGVMIAGWLGIGLSGVLMRKNGDFSPK